MEKDYIYEPLKTYKNELKDKHNENVNKYFDELVEKSQIDIAANKATITRLNKKTKLFDNIKKRISNYSFLRVFLIITAIVLFVLPLFHFNSDTYNLDFLGILIIALEFIVGIVLIVLIFKKINPFIKSLKTEKNVLRKRIDELTKEASIQMQPLNDLFEEEMALQLFKQTLPLINFDKYFDTKRLEYLVKRFGLSDAPDYNRSTLYVKSGDINGNPFYISNDLVHSLGTKTYTGSIIISWTTYTTVNGKRVSQRRTQTLTASVNKPYPYYKEQSYLVYGNDAAPDLIFTREDSDAENMNEKQIDRHVKRKVRKLQRKERKAIKKGGTFTTLAHSEFEVLFGAHDRNNEVQFRLLFTPLAQKQLLDLMKDKTIGYGDNFDFTKYKKINFVYPEHLDLIKLNVHPSYFHDIDFEKIKKRFIDYNNEYFKAVYFAFAPILSIPLYQQNKPHEYIYGDLYDGYVSFYEHESVVNTLGEERFKHKDSNTRNILKASLVKSGNNFDHVNVTAYGYKTEPRVDYVPRVGGDGRTHLVPVHWTEYIPVTETTKVDINVVNEEKNMTYRDHFENYIKKLKDDKDIDKKDLILLNKFFARVYKK